MSMEALRWARGVRGITGGQKAVLLLLADQANDAGECWPSVIGLAEDACMSERGTRDALRAIEEAGLLARVEGGGRHRTTLYRLALTPAETRQPVPETRQPLPPYRAAKTRQILPERGHSVPETRQSVPERGQPLPPNPQEPSRTPKEPKERRAAAPVAVMLPPWLPSDAWAEWCRHRIRLKRNGWTDAAAVRCIRDLAKFRDAGDDPRAVIDQSIAGGWTGLFPLRRAAKPKPSNLDWMIQEAADRADAMARGGKRVIDAMDAEPWPDEPLARIAP